MTADCLTCGGTGELHADAEIDVKLAAFRPTQRPEKPSPLMRMVDAATAIVAVTALTGMILRIGYAAFLGNGLLP